MRIQQDITRQGAHLVLTLTEQPSGRVLGRRVWENATQYISGEEDGVVAILVPISSELHIKPNVGAW